jgi:hypothetical protein
MTKRIAIFYPLLALRLLAQVDTGTIVGTLRDPSGGRTKCDGHHR